MSAAAVPSEREVKEFITTMKKQMGPNKRMMTFDKSKTNPHIMNMSVGRGNELTVGWTSVPGEWSSIPRPDSNNFYITLQSLHRIRIAFVNIFDFAEVDINFNSLEWDKRWSCIMPAKKGGEEWKAGEKVEADFNGEWFPATISKIMTRGKIQVDWGDSLSTLTKTEIRRLPGDKKKNKDELFQVSDDESNKSEASDDGKKKKSSSKQKASSKKSKQSDSDSSSDDDDDKKKNAKKKPSSKKAAAKKSAAKKASKESDSDSSDDDKKKKPSSKKSAKKDDKTKVKRTDSGTDEQKKRPKPDSKKSRSKSKKDVESDEEIDSETILEALSQMESLLIKSKDVDPSTAKGKIAVAQLKALSETSSEIPKFKKSFTPLLREVRKQIRETKSETDKKSAKKSAKKDKTKREDGTDSEGEAKRVKKPKVEKGPKPRKPLSVQGMHGASIRKKLTKEHPDKTPSEINDLISEAWKDIADDDKSALEAKHEEATEKWDKAVEEWEKSDSKKDKKDDKKQKDSKKEKGKTDVKPKATKPQRSLPLSSTATSWFAIANYTVDVEAAIRGGLSSRKSATALVARGKDIAKVFDTFYRLDFSDKDLSLYDIHKECVDKLRQLQGKTDIDHMHISILIDEPPTFKKSAQQLYKQTILSDITKKDPKMSAKDINAAVTQRWSKLSKETLKEWRQTQKEAKESFISNYISKERYRFVISKEQVEKLDEALSKLENNDEVPEVVSEIFKSPQDLKVVMDIPSDRSDQNEEIKTHVGESAEEILKFAREVLAFSKFKTRNVLSVEERKSLKKQHVDALDNSRDYLIKLRNKLFTQFCEKPTPEMGEVVKQCTKKIQPSLGERLMDSFNSSEFELNGWNVLLFEIRDIVDELDLEQRQARRPLKQFSFGSSKVDLAPVGKVLPHESTVSLDPLPNPTALRSSIPHHLFGDAVHCWLNLHVFAQAFRLTRFPLHQFIEAITTAAETKLLKAIYCQLLGCINDCDGESKQWPADVAALLAKDTELDEHDSDTESDEDDESSEADEDSSNESESSSSDSDSDSVSESASASVSVSASDSSSAATSGSNSDSDASGSDSDGSSNSDSTGSSSVSSSSSPKKKLTERQKASAKKQLQLSKEAKEKAKEDKKREKIEAAARKKKAAERKATMKKKRAEEKKERAEERQKEKEEREKEKEESKLTDEEKAVLRESLAEEEYAAGDYLSEAIRQTIDSTRESGDSSCKDWDLTTRIILLRGLLRKASHSKQIADAVRGSHKKLAAIKTSLTAKEQAANKQHQTSLTTLRESGTKEGKGYDAQTTSRIEEVVSEYKSTIETLRFESWLDSSSNDPCCRPLGSDRQGRLYFKFPTDHRLYVYTHHVPLKRLQAACGVIEGAEQDQHVFNIDGDVDMGNSQEVDNDEEKKEDGDEEKKEDGAEVPTADNKGDDKCAAPKQEKETSEEKKDEPEVESKEQVPMKVDSDPKQNGADKEEDDAEGSESDSNSDAEVADSIPHWIVMNGSWGTYPVNKITPLLSTETSQEYSLQAKLTGMQNFLPMQQTHRVKRYPGAMDIRRYTNKYTTYGFSYLPDEDKVDP